MPVTAELAFIRPENAFVDAEGRPRARGVDPDDLHDQAVFAMERCQVGDCSAPDGLEPDLDAHGFAHADLTGVSGLNELFDSVRVAGRVEAGQAAEIRRRLKGASIPLSGGRRLRLLFISPEGFIMRRGGPNGLRVTDSATALGMNEHDAAVSVHADQNVYGTPVRQLLRGVGPWLLRHRSPSGSNRWSPLHLLNLWVPLQQATRPLALMEVDSLDRSAHQLHYGLSTEGFLERPEDQRVNDIWAFLHHPDQRWHFTSETGPHSAYVFETLGTPHGAFMLPGEELAELLYRRVEAAIGAVASSDSGALREACRPVDGDFQPPVTRPLIEATEALKDVLADGVEQTHTAEGPWLARAEAALDGVIRKSLEMRVVGLVTRDWS